MIIYLSVTHEKGLLSMTVENNYINAMDFDLACIALEIDQEEAQEIKAEMLKHFDLSKYSINQF